MGFQKDNKLHFAEIRGLKMDKPGLIGQHTVLTSINYDRAGTSMFGVADGSQPRDLPMTL